MLQEHVRRLLQSNIVLDNKSPWQLSKRAEDQLKEGLGFEPAGGWPKFISLLAGTDYISATKDGYFKREKQPGDVEDEEVIRRKLVNAFVEDLVPPPVAAGLFIMIGLHPAWGLRIAGERHGRSDDLDHLFSSESLQIGKDTVNGALGFLVDYLTEHPRGNLGEVAEAFAERVDTLYEEGKARYGELDVEDVPLFLGDSPGSSSFHAADFILELFEDWLVPARVAVIEQDVSNGQSVIEQTEYSAEPSRFKDDSKFMDVLREAHKDHLQTISER